MHPATGWFISHGGWNSTQEAFVYRVPQILWPFAADQPYNSALCRKFTKPLSSSSMFKDLAKSEQPKFTVDAVRKEIDDLLVKLKGEEGVVVRNNFEKLATAFLSGWEKKGEARQNMERFLKKYVD
ncbi:hypothetical protein K435DRAFT_875155 [Dendrothele bispora CBS 962.96]|uniref:UDP-Glycosyltransferase/glycogen phosphorylase n=1 Tax=Dendrothele bispora (strain CBS 962.96) TaxID=1314807 RepID=A0A4S8KUW8_DENBC|nr:hypothetical protein K435DRAFT_875155 [Dendrothele bispora CBS 962.96]